MVDYNKWQKISVTIVSILLGVGVLACAICDVAVFGEFTWSLISISSIVFAGLVFLPVIRFGKKGMIAMILIFDVLVIPYLFVLNTVIPESDLLLPIGIPTAIIAIVFIWVIWCLFRLFKNKKLLATSITLLLTIPTGVLVNTVLSKLIEESMWDVWDAFYVIVLGIIALVLLVIHFNIHKKDLLHTREQKGVEEVKF